MPVSCDLWLDQQPSCSLFQTMLVESLRFLLSLPCTWSSRTCMPLRHSISPLSVRQIFRRFLCVSLLTTYFLSWFDSQANAILGNLISYFVSQKALVVWSLVYMMPLSGSHKITASLLLRTFSDAMRCEIIALMAELLPKVLVENSSIASISAADFAAELSTNQFIPKRNLIAFLFDCNW